MELNKYQFFIIGESDGKNFTFLEMDIKGFQKNKDELLSQGFFVDGEVILANTAEEAVEKYKQEHQKILSGGIASRHPFLTFFTMLGEKLRQNQ
ncbi:hypothetical protein [Vibrio ezurae]|uniref:Uncharacterized protein n=1 Tax=Vibrio ezurae NBRC 102218 TaxID=1219080 RepID=U3B349_9VIBR|nr:hypothetical protein [Vibrio ezurae]GAD80360.1 hypothetical protein VEZ01S_33_00620 [Vibrio ezurae NBRC 102218]